MDEIEIYFSFLEDTVNRTPQLFYPDTKVYKPIAQEMTKILKDNGFLLLYNLVESSITKAIEEIYVELNNKNGGFRYRSTHPTFDDEWVSSPRLAQIQKLSFAFIQIQVEFQIPILVQKIYKCCHYDQIFGRESDNLFYHEIP